MTESGNEPLYSTKDISFSFASYVDKILRIKYKTTRVWFKNPEKLPVESGVIEFDLSNYGVIGDPIAVKVTPYVAYEDFLVKRIETQPDGKDWPTSFSAWGTILAGELLQLSGGSGSITPGRDFSSFISNSKSSGYLNLKLYFEDGRIFTRDISTFIYFSGAILTSSAFGELIPNTSIMKIAISIESILGILWLGLLVGLATSWIFQNKSSPQKEERRVDSSMNKIIGSVRVEKIKEQILRASITLQDLSYSVRTINYLCRHLNNADDIVIESLTANAVVAYTRCFNSEFSYSLSADIFENSLPAETSAGQISERQFHYLIMNYRNKHIAHSDNFLKAMTVGGALINGQYAVGPITAVRVLKEEMDFYHSLSRLAAKAQEVVSDRLSNLQNKLTELLQTGEATLSSESASITPIPLGVSPQELWGLSEL